MWNLIWFIIGVFLSDKIEPLFRNLLSIVF